MRLSHRLTTSAAVLVGDPGDLTPTLEKMYRAMGQELPTVKRTLELNPNMRWSPGSATPTGSGRRTRDWPKPRRCSTVWRCWRKAANWPTPRSSSALLSKRLEKQPVLTSR